MGARKTAAKPRATASGRKARTASKARQPSTANARARKDRRSADWGPAFLEAFRQSGNVRVSALSIGIDRTTVYARRKTDPEFVAAMDQAGADASDLLLAEARRRAMNGVPEPIVYKGKVVGTVTKYSDNLLMFLLKGLRRDLFGDRVEVRHIPDAAIEDEIARLERELADRAGDEAVPTE